MSLFCISTLFVLILDVQSFCQFSGPLKTLKQIENCRTVNGDLIIGQKTDTSWSGRRRIKEISDCLRIENSRLENLAFLDLDARLFKKEYNCSDSRLPMVIVSNNTFLKEETKLEEMVRDLSPGKVLIRMGNAIQANVISEELQTKRIVLPDATCVMNKFSAAFWLFLVTTFAETTTPSTTISSEIPATYDTMSKTCTFNDYDYRNIKKLPVQCDQNGAGLVALIVPKNSGTLDLSDFSIKEYKRFFPDVKPVNLMGSLTVTNTRNLTQINLPAIFRDDAATKLVILRNPDLEIIVDVLLTTGPSTILPKVMKVIVAGNPRLDKQPGPYEKTHCPFGSQKCLHPGTWSGCNALYGLFNQKPDYQCYFNNEAIPLLGDKSSYEIKDPSDLDGCDYVLGKLKFESTYKATSLPKVFQTTRIEGCVSIQGAQNLKDIRWLEHVKINITDKYDCKKQKIDVQLCLDGDVVTHLKSIHNPIHVQHACLKKCSGDGKGLKYDFLHPNEAKCEFITGNVVIENVTWTKRSLPLKISEITGMLNIMNNELKDLSFLQHLKNVTCDAPETSCVTIQFNNFTKAWKFPPNLKITNKNPAGKKLSVILNDGYNLTDVEKKYLSDHHQPLDIFIRGEILEILRTTITTTTTTTSSTTTTIFNTTTTENTTSSTSTLPTTTTETTTNVPTTTVDLKEKTALDAHNKEQDEIIRRKVEEEEATWAEYQICLVVVAVIIGIFYIGLLIFFCRSRSWIDIEFEKPEFELYVPEDRFETDTRERVRQKLYEYLERERVKEKAADDPEKLAALEAAENVGVPKEVLEAAKSVSSKSSSSSPSTSEVATESETSLAEGEAHKPQDHITYPLSKEVCDILEHLDDTFSFWDSKTFLFEMIRQQYEEQRELIINREFDFERFCEGVTESNREFKDPKRYYPNLLNNHILYRYIPENSCVENKENLEKFDPETHIRHFFSSVKNYTYSYEYIMELLEWCWEYRERYSDTCFHKEIRGPCNVTGDVHGSIRDLQAFLSMDITGEATKVGVHPMLYYQWLFCGDMMDRSNRGLDSLLFMLVAGVYLPNFHILRGNHDLLGGDGCKQWLESNIENKAAHALAVIEAKQNGKMIAPYEEFWSIVDEWSKWKATTVRDDEGYAGFMKKYHEEIDDLKNSESLLFELLNHFPYNGEYINIHFKLRKVVAHIPLTATINNRIFCAHGGFGWPVYNMEFLKKVHMPFDMNTWNIDYLKSGQKFLEKCKVKSNMWEHVANAVLWSDPHVVACDSSTRNCGHLLDNECIIGFLKKENFDMIIRGHQNRGYQLACGNRCVTVYCSKHTDKFLDEMESENEKKEADLMRYINPAISSAVRINRDGSLQHILIGTRFEKICYIGDGFENLRNQCKAKKGFKQYRNQEKNKMRPRLHFDDMDSGPLTEKVDWPKETESEKKKAKEMDDAD